MKEKKKKIIIIIHVILIIFGCKFIIIIACMFLLCIPSSLRHLFLEDMMALKRALGVCIVGTIVVLLRTCIFGDGLGAFTHGVLGQLTG